MPRLRLRGDGPSDKFGMIPHWFSRDPSFTPHSKAVLLLLLSHSNGWDIDEAAVSRGTGIGRDAVRKAMRLLQDRNVLERRPTRDERNVVTGWEWIVNRPGDEEPEARFLKTQKVAQPEGGNHPPHKKNNPKKNISEKTRVNPADAGRPDLPVDNSTDLEPHGRKVRWRSGDEIPRGTEGRLADAMAAVEHAGFTSQVITHMRSLPDWSAVKDYVRRWIGVQTSSDPDRRAQAQELLAEARVPFLVTDEEWTRLSDETCLHSSVEFSGYCTSCAERVTA